MSESETARKDFARVRARHGAQDKPVFSIDDSWCECLCDGQFGPMFLVHCPACGFDYNHLSTSEPRRLFVRDDFGDGMGQRISFWGECGHYWTLHFGTHKGQTFAAFTLDGNEFPEEEAEEACQAGAGCEESPP
jgi:hypothetical protein